MPKLPGRLGALTAGDVMTRDVIVVREDDTLEGAVQTLKKNSITGAPVVGRDNKLVGILSIADLVERKPPAGSAEVTPPPAALAHGEDVMTWDLFEKARRAPSESWSGDESTVEHVGTRMTRQVTSVKVDAPLVQVARAMCDGHWHRVPVVDEAGGLAGIISTMDVLAALVNTADEPE